MISPKKQIFQKTFEKALDKRLLFEYNINVAMREWRNWQTRTFEGRVVYTVRVQVPFLAPYYVALIDAGNETPGATTASGVFHAIFLK